MQHLPSISDKFNGASMDPSEATKLGYHEIATTLEIMGKQPMTTEMVKAYGTRLALAMEFEGEEADQVVNAFTSQMKDGKLDRKGMLRGYAEAGKLINKWVDNDFTREDDAGKTKFDREGRLEELPPPDIRTLVIARNLLKDAGIKDDNGAIATNLATFMEVRGGQISATFTPSLPEISSALEHADKVAVGPSPAPGTKPR